MRKFFVLFVLILTVMNLSAQTTGKLTVTVTTVAYGGTFSPYNVLAIWVQNKSGAYAKTLLAYASIRKTNLTSWGTVTSLTYNVVDAITGATQSSHGVRTCSWNGENTTGTVLGDDTYNVVMEMSEGSNNKRATFAIVKGKTKQTVTPTNVAGFSNITITWTPTSTGINDVEVEKLFVVYPNPAKNFIKVGGVGIQEIQLYNLSGKCILKTMNQQIDIRELKKGEYVLKIMSQESVFSKKIIKN